MVGGELVVLKVPKWDLGLGFEFGGYVVIPHAQFQHALEELATPVSHDYQPSLWIR